MGRLPSLGIIGGAGPEAGALVFQQVIRICQKEHNCQRDYDFPLIKLVSYPFSEMLESDHDPDSVRREVKEVYQQLDTDYVLIACNTLHTFLDESFSAPRFLHLIQETKNALSEKPLVLCSTTSRENQVHQKFFSCLYPDAELQKQVDSLIDAVLGRGVDRSLSNDLQKLIELSGGEEIVLGCTELSLINERYPQKIEGVPVVDPSWNIAQKACSLIFEKR